MTLSFRGFRAYRRPGSSCLQRLPTLPTGYYAFTGSTPGIMCQSFYTPAIPHGRLMPHHRTCKQKAEEDGRKRQAALQKLRGPLYSPPFHLQRPRELAYSQGQSDESVRDLCTVQRRHRFTQVNHLLLAPRTLLDRSEIRCQSPGQPRPRTFVHSSESHSAATQETV